MYSLALFDDERWVRTLIESLIPFASYGLEMVAESDNGATALALCKEYQPDIVITDIQMPGLTGLELIEAIRNETANTEIIIISGFDEFEYAKKAIRFRVNEYLLKPVEEHQLHDALKTSMNNIDKRIQESHRIRSLKRNLKRLRITSGVQNESIDISCSDARISKILSLIHTYFMDPISIQSASEEIGMNPTYFSELFKKTTGKGFCQYVSDVRLAKAKELIREKPHLKVQDIAVACGFSDPNYFSRLFRKKTGYTFTDYKRRLSEECPDNPK